MKLTIPIAKNLGYRAVLSILNFTTQMTETELDIVSTMLDNNIRVLTRRTRASLLTLLKKDKFTLNNHISRLKDKGILTLNEDRWFEINPNLVQRIDDSLKDEEIKLELHVS